MGEQGLETYTDPQRLRLFMKSLLNDVQALRRMIADGLIESGVRRIGAEQELCLIDRAWRPAGRAADVLALLDPERFTPEIGKFNVEFNLSPCRFGGDCLSRLESELNRHLDEVRMAAADLGLDVVMTGILPTLRKSDMGLHNMMERTRYHALNEALMRLRGDHFDLRLTGTDELIIKHDSVMMEACNTSCQFHFQVSPEEFAHLYNVAQAVTAPVLAASVNSPFLFGRRLWRETRIALFQQAVDTRPTGNQVLDRSARVSFGEDWVQESVVEIYQDDISRFRVVLGIDVEENSMDTLDRGGIPTLKALQMHNSTVYRWNRPCYGVLDGKPTLRIENRALPAGPTVVDEVANAAFWFGLVSGMIEAVTDVRAVLGFDQAKSNFLAAARQGLEAQFEWIGGCVLPASTLIREQLVPMAREGLQEARVDRDDIERFLDVIEQRVDRRQTGATWLLGSYGNMKEGGIKMGEIMGALVSATLSRQKEGNPVHEWSLAEITEAGHWRHGYQRVEQYMTTDLFTVHEDEVIDLVANVMDWKHIRHVPVEDDTGRLVGLVSYRSLLRLLARDLPHGKESPVAVKDVMTRQVHTIPPETGTLEAIAIMRKHKVACLPVVTGGRLVGIVSERDFLRIAGELLTSQFNAEG
ncbi:MAG TPA: glutamate-cysteine ligase family protein [bacterium]|nr:glutamate-cysteine ligase family protein [bacterium]